MEKETEKSKKKDSPVFNIIVILLTVIIGIFTVRAVYSRARGETYFLFNRFSIILVLTESMEPGIPAKSYILVEKVAAGDVKVGDIITFKSEDPSIKGELNTHRVVRINGGTGALSFVTKGDNNASEDIYEVPAANVVARHLATLGFLTGLGKFITSVYGIIVIDGLIVVTAGLVIFRIFKKRKKGEEENKPVEISVEEMKRLVDEEVERLKRADSEKKDKKE